MLHVVMIEMVIVQVLCDSCDLVEVGVYFIAFVLSLLNARYLKMNVYDLHLYLNMF